MRPDISTERVGDAILFHAGAGEWFNQPHNKRWDMGDDVADLPPSAWHLGLDRAIEADARTSSHVVVDVRDMFWLVGQDWGYLVRLSRRLKFCSVRLSLLATRRIFQGGQLLGMHKQFCLADSLKFLLGDGPDPEPA